MFCFLLFCLAEVFLWILFAKLHKPVDPNLCLCSVTSSGLWVCVIGVFQFITCCFFYKLKSVGLYCCGVSVHNMLFFTSSSLWVCVMMFQFIIIICCSLQVHVYGSVLLWCFSSYNMLFFTRSCLWCFSW